MLLLLILLLLFISGCSESLTKEVWKGLRQQHEWGTGGNILIECVFISEFSHESMY